jgi:hypothetical protein
MSGNPNAPYGTQEVNKQAKKANINAVSFLLTSGESIILDSDPYINNKTIQVNTFNTSIILTVSLDGKTFLPGPSISAIGIYKIPLPCRYIQLQASGNCSGLVLGSL